MATPPIQQQNFSGTRPNGTNIAAPADEVSVVQPVQLRQGRGARLSFLGGRKKDQASQEQQRQQHPPPPPIPQTNGDHLPNGDAESATSGHSRGKDNPNRRSFFRVTSAEAKVDTGSSGHRHEWSAETPVSGTTAPGRQSSDISTTQNSRESRNPGLTSTAPEQTGGARMGNVRKRLSMLKLGKKSSKGSGLMGSLDEE